MTPRQFRKIALSFPDSVESAHMGHPDFRVCGRVFASLGAPSADWAMVKLTPEQQKVFCDADVDMFQPCNGAWGRQGCTNVRLSDAKSAVVRSALSLAVENVATSSSRKPMVARSSRAQPRTKPAASTSTAVPTLADSHAVAALLRNLEHPLKPVIESVRVTILKSNKRITEGIKWNAPSFYHHGWFATLYLRAKSGVVLVLHRGAKARSKTGLRSAISDPSKLLTWASADRATITFGSATDFKRKQAALKSIIKQWAAFQVEQAEPSNQG